MQSFRLFVITMYTEEGLLFDPGALSMDQIAVDNC
jgi:hypothetical protein